MLLARLQPPLNETLDHSGGGERVFFEENLIVGNEGIGLDKNLPRLQNNFSEKGIGH